MLSRLLYFNDEVIYSFLDGLLKKKSIKEVYFWLSEYYYSGFQEETWTYIFKIYYDFYAITNPKLESFLVKNYNSYQKSENIEYILNCVKTLYHSKSNPIIFCLSNIKYNNPTSIYVGRVPKWLKQLNIDNKNNINLIRIINEFNWNKCNKLLFYLNKCEDYKMCYQDVITYFKSKSKIKNKLVKLETIPYDNYKHIILTLIIHCCLNEKEIKKNKVISNYDSNECAIIKEFDNLLNPNKILKTYRYYYTSTNIGCFDLYRYRNNDLQFILDNWDYYCFKTPLWNDIIKKYNGKQKSLKKTLKFSTAENCEDFYNKYGYEPDEQDKETQQKSLINIEKNNVMGWLNQMYDYSVLYEQLPSKLIY